MNSNKRSEVKLLFCADVHQCSENMCSNRYTNKIMFRNTMDEQRRQAAKGTRLVPLKMVQMAMRSEIWPLSSA